MAAVYTPQMDNSTTPPIVNSTDVPIPMESCEISECATDFVPGTAITPGIDSAETVDPEKVRSLFKTLIKTYKKEYSPQWEMFDVCLDYLEFLRKNLPTLPNVEEHLGEINDFIHIVFTRDKNKFEPFFQSNHFKAYYTSNHPFVNKALAKINQHIIFENNVHRLTDLPKTNLKRKWGENSHLGNPSVSPPLSTKNRFDVLANDGETAPMEESQSVVDNDGVSQNNEANNQSNEKVKHRKPYQLIFEITKNYKTILEEMYKLSDHISTKIEKNHIQMLTDSEDDFRRIQKYLSENHVPLRSINLKEEKPVKFILYGLPAITDKEDIENALRSVDIEPLFVAYMSERVNGIKTPMSKFVLTLKNTPALVEKLDSLKKINRLDVSFETYTPTGVPQCYRCQRFGHSSLTCNLTPRCLKCSGPHRAKDCNVQKEYFKCANCMGNHTANYKGCPLHPDNKNYKSTKNNKNNVRYVPAPAPKTNAWSKSTSENSTSNLQINDPEQFPELRQPSTSRKSQTLPRANVSPANIENQTNYKASQANNDSETTVTQQNEAPRSVQQKNVSQQLVQKQTNYRHQPRHSKNASDSTRASNETSSIREMLEIFRMFKEIKANLDLVQLWEFFKTCTTIMRSGEDPSQKIYLIFEAVTNFVDAPNHG